MSLHDSSDDFSQLPTADGVIEEGHSPHDFSRQPPPRRQQTRIGPRTTAQPAPAEQPSEAPAENRTNEQDHHQPDEPPSLSDDWHELIQSPEIAESLANDWKHWPPQSEAPAPVPRPAPRRTVVGRRAPQAEETPPPTSEEGSESIQPEEVPPSPPDIPEEIAQENPPAEAASEPAAKPEPTPSSSDKSSPDETSSPTPESSKKETPPTDTTSSAAKEASPPSVPPGPWMEKWQRWGGQALSLSVGIHALLLIGGATFVVNQIREPQVDFIPGGSQQGAAASQALEHKIQQKKSPWLKKAMPARKLAAVGSISDIVLPDEVPDLMDLPQSRDLSGGKLTAGMGLGGAGGGFGKSMGLGSQSGMVFQPFSMFGMEIKAKRLALILDVSTSMAPHLPRVIAEVDRMSKGSIVILYFGCGIESPPPGGLDGDEVYSTSSVEFEKFWRLGGATLSETRKYRIDPSQSIQSESIFRLLSKRPQTYFIHNTGLGYTWLALLNDKVRNADGLYWFSDFQDRVDFKQLVIVRENLERRKQRLYMHAYTQGGSYDLIRTQLVEPTKGDVKLEE
ncbi:hypothetical protein [Prosthecobacter fusiformis]|nr:hypothetical protein [Prosthecobacter fusiformis]